MELSDVIAKLSAEKSRLDAELSHRRAELVSLENEKGEKIKEIKARHLVELTDLDAIYSEIANTGKTQVRDIQADMARIDRAIGALVPSKPVSAAAKEERVTSEMIQDAIVLFLFQNGSEATVSSIASMLDSRKYLDENKNKMSVVHTTINNMVRAGTVFKKNLNMVVLADETEATQRVKIRKFVLSSLATKPMTTIEIERSVIKAGLLSGENTRRRVRGVLLGLSQGQYVVRETSDDVEYFSIPNGHYSENSFSQVD